MNAKSIIGAVALLSAGTSFSYDTLVWTGRYDDNFDTSTANWTNQQTGAEAVFEGVDASNKQSNPIVFRVPEDSDITVAINQKNEFDKNMGMNPASILFDVDGTMTFTNNHSDYFLNWANGPWTKTGTGTVDCNTTLTRMFIGPTSLTVEEGEFWCTGNYMLQYWFNSNKPITVKDGAKFAMRGTNMDGGVATHASKGKITVEAGGQFHIDTFDNAGVTVKKGCNNLPAMEFNRYDGFDYANCWGYDNTSIGMFRFSGDITLKDTQGTHTPYAWMASDAYAENRAVVNLWSSPIVDFNVADVTGDAATDFEMNLQLSDHYTNTTADAFIPAGFSKSGAGTMRLTNVKNKFTGDVEVKGGTLQLGQDSYNDRGYHGTTHLGRMDTNPDRKITVSTGATLELLGGITFGNADSPYYEPYSSITNDHIVGEFIFDGGALKIADGKWNAFPNLTFKNGGTVNTGSNSGGNEGAGRLKVLDTFSVLKGTVNTPFVWPFDAETYASRGAPKMYAGQGFTLNGYPENTFRVENLTDDDGVDATFEVPFFIPTAYFRDWRSGNHQLNDWKFGFTKTGDGTMRYTAPSIHATSGAYVSGIAYCTYNGDTKVEEGTLQMDGDIHLSDTVRVAEGACLAGTGTVNNVALAAGAGWKAPAGQTEPMIVTGNLTAGENLTVSITVSEGVSYREDEIRATLFRVEGTVTGLENILDATVKVNGTAAPGLHPVMKDGVVTVRYAKGMMLIYR